MEAGIGYQQTRRVAPAAIFLFFFNTCLLPQGFSFTLLLTPVWVYLLHREARVDRLRPLLAALLLYAPIHWYLGADLLYYTISMTLLLCIVIFCIWLRPHLNEAIIDYERIIYRFVEVNFLFTLLSVPL